MNDVRRGLWTWSSRFPGVAAVVALLLSVAAANGRADAFVRVNQLGYEVGTDSRAYLMSTTSESGAVFKVVNAKGVGVFSRKRLARRWVRGENSPCMRWTSRSITVARTRLM